MSKPLPRTTIKRLKWIKALEEHGDMQCEGALFAWNHRVQEELFTCGSEVKATQACAIGIYFLEVEPFLCIPIDSVMQIELVAERTGLAANQVGRIVDHNDGGKLFIDLAAELRTF